MLKTVGQFGLQYIEQNQGTLGSLVATPSLFSRVIESLGQDAKIVSIRDRVQSGIGDEGWTIHVDGSLRYRGWVVVPQLIHLRDEILREFHCSRFAVHSGGTKMYQDLRRQYYWKMYPKKSDGPIVRNPRKKLHTLSLKFKNLTFCTSPLTASHCPFLLFKMEKTTLFQVLSFPH